MVVCRTSASNCFRSGKDAGAAGRRDRPGRGSACQRVLRADDSAAWAINEKAAAGDAPAPHEAARHRHTGRGLGPPSHVGRYLQSLPAPREAAHGSPTGGAWRFAPDASAAQDRGGGLLQDAGGAGA